MLQIIDYVDIRDTVVSILNTANTTTATYDLSTNLDKRVVEVVGDDLSIRPKWKPKYPLISVRMVGKQEQLHEFGQKQYGKIVNLNMELNFVYDSFQNAETNLYDMVRNAEAVLRADQDLSGYNKNANQITSVNMGNVEFVDNINDESDFNKSATLDIDVECVLHYTGVLVWDTDNWDTDYWME